MKLYKKTAYLSMPWKNGLGMTEQIQIFPEACLFSEGQDFLWRISSAKIQGASPFSQFPGCDRWLMVLTGQGLLLEGAALYPEEPIHFSGESPLHCSLLGGEVTDLGIIYRRDKISAVMCREEFLDTCSLDLPEGIHFIYCLNEPLKIAENFLDSGDSLEITGPAKITIESSLGGKTKFVRIHIQER
ncbi:MAG: HutD/Ves family protein [Pseudobdellovibrionaceae bacterium]